MQELADGLGKDLAEVIEAICVGGAPPNIDGLAYIWIRNNAQRAKELADFWLGSSNGIQRKLLTNGNGAIT